MGPKKDPKKDGKKDELSAEEKLEAELKLLESEKADLGIECSFLKDKLKQSREENGTLRKDVEAVKARLEKASQDYADILQHRSSQIKVAEIKLSQLLRKGQELEENLSNRSQRVSDLENLCDEQKAKLEESSNLMNDKEQLEEAVRRQHKLIDGQAEELHKLREEAQGQEVKLAQAADEIEELKLRAMDRTDLAILFDDLWLVKCRYRKLGGEVPADREGATLTGAAGGKQLILQGGGSPHNAAAREVVALDLENLVWERPGTAKTPYSLSQHAACSLSRTKVFNIGGLKNGYHTGDVAVLNTDNMKWQEMAAKLVGGPSARMGAACASVRERVFVFGGELADGSMTDEIWVLDFEPMQWNRVEGLGAAPSARRGASMCPTEDGRRLYVFGGYDGVKVLNDVHTLETERLVWSPVHVTTACPEPRCGHCAAIIRHFMVVSGGSGMKEGGALRALADVHVMDLFNPQWEAMVDVAWGDGRTWMERNGCYSTFIGPVLVVVKPDRERKLNELQTITLCLPEDIERMKSEKKKDNRFQDKLELLDDGLCTQNSVEVAWMPPTKNVDRIDGYKLMMATSTGLVKDVYQGKEPSHRVGGLRPNTEYIFCVKALYDDGSFTWSESKAFRTCMVARGREKAPPLQSAAPVEVA